MKEEAQNRFIKKFEEKLNEVSNKEYLIKNEISQIEALSSHKENSIITSPSKIFSVSHNKNRSVFDLNGFGSIELIMDVFHDYILFGNIDHLKDQKNHFNKSAFELGIELAEYYKWLKELQIPKSKGKFTDLSNEQRLLAISFLCPDLANYTKTQSAKVLSQILNVGKENIRKNLSHLFIDKNNSEVRTIENLEKLSELFDNKAFEHITNKIEREIKDIKRKVVAPQK